VPHVVCNNAGVSGTFGPIWETTDGLGVGARGQPPGVVHGIQAFVPAMVDAGHEGHVVNTSSVLGLSTGGGSIYSVTKHAVTRLTEGLWYDLRGGQPHRSTSVLCPGLIATRIVTATATGPRTSADHGRTGGRGGCRRMEAAQAYFLESGMPPAEVADLVVDAIRAGRFYILTHPERSSVR
jgi:NAD(P)-dependent dehydrogenase (short-subunit alcohol dehydrogenase family)